VTEPSRFACPCCGCLTLPNRPPGTFALCPVCWWEDDSVQFADPDWRGGANDPSLDEARENYRRIGASDPDFLHRVGPPGPDEIPVGG
jgi:hypothetical protein